MTHQGPVEPVPVHMTNAAELGAAVKGHPHRKHVQSVFRTFVLAGAVPIPILAEDRSRLTTWLVAYNSSVVLCASQSQAQDPDNQIASGLGAAWANTPANPQGTLLFVPILIGPPVNSAASVRWTLNTTEVVWAVSMAAAVLAMTIESEADSY